MIQLHCEKKGITLAETCKKVTVVQNLAYLTGEKATADALLSRENVEVICRYWMIIVLLQSFANAYRKDIPEFNQKAQTYQTTRICCIVSYGNNDDYF